MGSIWIYMSRVDVSSHFLLTRSRGRKIESEFEPDYVSFFLSSATSLPIAQNVCNAINLIKTALQCPSHHVSRQY